MNTPSSWLRLAVSLAAATAALAPGSVCAGSADADALFLFKEGKRLMTSGAFAQACEKFEASDRIKPASGTELNLGRCRNKNGQQASAWVAYLQAAATAKHEGNKRNENEARDRAAEIEPRLVYLTIAVPEDARADGLVIKRNGAAVDAAMWNERVPVDSDDYTITAEAPGYRPWSARVAVKTRSNKVEVPPLDKLPEAPPAAPPGVAAGPDEPSGARGAGGAEAGSAPSRWTGKRKLSLVLAAVGVAAAGTGIGLGLHASSLESQADRNCDATTCTTVQAAAANRSARHYALAADIGFAAGGVAVVGAAALWLLGAPSSHDTVAIVPTLDATHVGISFARSF
jgi:hypothetical protein